MPVRTRAVWRGRFDRPEGIAILLAEHRRVSPAKSSGTRPSLMPASRPRVALFGIARALAANSCPDMGEIARATELPVEQLEQALDRAALWPAENLSPESSGCGQGRCCPPELSMLRK